MAVQGVDVALYLLRVFVFLFDIITFPIYKLLQQPWKERTKQNHGKVLVIIIVLAQVEKSNKTIYCSHCNHSLELIPFRL